MTGYALATAEVPAGQLSLELRAVNSRYFELALRMAEEFRPLEPILRERLAARIHRGKLECRINLSARADAQIPSAPDPERLARLAKLAAAVHAAIPEAAPLSVGEVLRWPGLFSEPASDPEATQQVLLGLLDAALHDFEQTRAREGEKLKAAIQERVAAMRGHLAALRPKTPELVTAFRDKLQRRLEELLAGSDPDRLMQEVALFAQKIDVAEELDRLDAHLTEVERVLQAGGTVGKRLDFLMQELNREANTLASKSVSSELTAVSVELKVLIEQMREQIQNIE